MPHFFRPRYLNISKDNFLVLSGFRLIILKSTHGLRSGTAKRLMALYLTFGQRLIILGQMRSHGSHTQITDVSGLKGFVRHASCMMSFMPDRVVRRFGFVQGIPADPKPARRAPVTREAVDQMWANFNNHLIQCGPKVEDGSPDTVDGYFAWYKRVSHPYLLSENYPKADDGELRQRIYQRWWSSSMRWSRCMGNTWQAEDLGRAIHKRD